MRILVLVKQVPDTYGERTLDLESGWVVRDASDAVIDEISERAIEIALVCRDTVKDTEVVLLAMGPAGATGALRKGLAMGADSALHVLDDVLAGSDLTGTARVLAAVASSQGQAFDLIIGGNESTDGGGGVIPAMIAEHLGWPSLTSLDSCQITAEQVVGTREAEEGTLTVRVALPAVISVTERSAEPRFPGFKGTMSAKKKPLAVITPSDLGVTDFVPRSRIVTVAERPPRTGGRMVVDQGGAANELVDFLAAANLI